MCDTIVALGNATADGYVLFGKNSDREPDEAQNVEIHEGGSRSEKEVKATYVSIPQIARIEKTLLCRPFWMFGAEMGANEHGVCIGNEALFTKEKVDEKGLTGMDLLRLALERSRTAKQALDTIIKLLEEHGQGGSGGYRHNLRYMNGFIIADREEAYVLETVKRWWAWTRVKDLTSISNIISQTDDFDECSKGLIENAVKKGYCKSESDFNFRKCYSDLFITMGARGADRECSSRALLKKHEGNLTPKNFMDILRDHGDPRYTPDWKIKGTVCMHAANTLTRPTQSTCSLVARLGEEGDAFFTTAAANPCMSPFFALAFPNGGLPEGYAPGGEYYDPASFWWLSERYHRLALFRFRSAREKIRPQIDRFENDMLEQIDSDGNPPSAETANRLFDGARSMVEKWGEEIKDMPPENGGFWFTRYWRKYNRLNKVPDRLP